MPWLAKSSVVIGQFVSLDRVYPVFEIVNSEVLQWMIVSVVFFQKHILLKATKFKFDSLVQEVKNLTRINSISIINFFRNNRCVSYSPVSVFRKTRKVVASHLRLKLECLKANCIVSLGQEIYKV